MFKLTIYQSRYITLLVCLLVIGGCSRIQIFYNQLDWLIPRYIDHYISLNDQQYDALGKHTEQFLHWHCSTHMQRYADWFARLSNDVQHSNLNTLKIGGYANDLQQFWDELVDQYFPGVAAILYQANDRQVTELFENISEKNKELFEELVAPPLGKVEMELAERMQDRFDNWLGSVTPAQLILIQVWSKKVAPKQRMRLVMRERWKHTLHRLFLYRQGLSQFSMSVLQLIKSPEQVWTQEYKRQFAFTRKSVLKLIAQTLSSLTDNQREYFINQTRSWARDLNKLSCQSKAQAVKKYIASGLLKRIVYQTFVWQKS